MPSQPTPFGCGRAGAPLARNLHRAPLLGVASPSRLIAERGLWRSLREKTRVCRTARVRAGPWLGPVPLRSPCLLPMGRSAFETEDVSTALCPAYILLRRAGWRAEARVRASPVCWQCAGLQTSKLIVFVFPHPPRLVLRLVPRSVGEVRPPCKVATSPRSPHLALFTPSPPYWLWVRTLGLSCLAASQPRGE